MAPRDEFNPPPQALVGIAEVNKAEYPFNPYAPKAIDADGVEYLPGVYTSERPNEDWAELYLEVGGEG